MEIEWSDEYIEDKYEREKIENSLKSFDNLVEAFDEAITNITKDEDNNLEFIGIWNLAKEKTKKEQKEKLMLLLKKNEKSIQNMMQSEEASIRYANSNLKKGLANEMEEEELEEERRAIVEAEEKIKELNKEEIKIRKQIRTLKGLFSSSIFSYKNGTKDLRINFSGIDKKKTEWKAREFQQKDFEDYEALLISKETSEYYYDEREWTKEEIETETNEWLNAYKEGKPLGAITILNENDEFLGYILAKARERGLALLAYNFLPKYWGRGIAQSVLKKMIEEWGSEVLRIGLNEKNEIIKNNFRCFGESELQGFYAAVRPINIVSWFILEKKEVGFKPVKKNVDNLNNPFNILVINISSLENYYKEIEKHIDSLYRRQKIEADKLYCAKDINNGKLHVFNRRLSGKIRFHYEKIISKE